MRLLSLALVVVLAQPTLRAAEYYFTHLAGPLGGPGNADGPATIARLDSPNALAFDAAGNLFVSDAGNRALRKVTPQGVVSTILAPDQTRVTFYGASGIAVDGAGNLFVSDASTHIIYRVSPTGDKSVFTGNNYGPFYSGAQQIGLNIDGPPNRATFFRPAGLAFDRLGNLFVADSGNHTIRKVAPDGSVTTVAGTPGISGTADGPGNTARFQVPSSLAFDAAGNLYVSDVSTVRKITPDGVVTTLAGQGGTTGSADGTGNAAQFFRPAIAVTSGGEILVADSGNHTIRRITSAAVVTTLAGVAGQTENADGPGAQARFWTPSAIVIDRDGNAIVADRDNDCLRKVTPAGVVSTFAGVAGGVGNADGTGSAARFNQPWGITVDSAGYVYVAAIANRGVRKISPDGVVTTIARTENYDVLRGPAAIAMGLDGKLVVAPGLPGTGGRPNTALKVSTDGAITDMTGQPFVPGQSAGGINAFTYLLGAAVHPNGSVYIADAANKKFWIYSPAGELSSLNIVSAEMPLLNPNGLAFDRVGNLYVADRNANTIDKITPDGVLTVFAGGYNDWGYRDGVGKEARFGGPCGVAVDAQGNVFVADTGTNTIRHITPAGVVTTIAGHWNTIGSADGVGPNAHFYTPHAIALGADGTLYVAEEWNHSIRKGQLARGPQITTQPRSQSIARGANATFSVAAAAVPSATYQWYFNGLAFNGATSDTLTISNVRPEDAGDYTVVVTNSLGTVTSARATLTVTTSPATPPAGGSDGSASGGGGAPSHWFGALVAVAAIARAMAQRSAAAR